MLLLRLDFTVRLRKSGHLSTAKTSAVIIYASALEQSLKDALRDPRRELLTITEEGDL